MSERQPATTAPKGPRRFYAEARAAETPAGFELRLDGRPARTPARAPLLIPGHALAEAVAAEWAGQGEHIEITAMRLTRLANTAIDRVAPRRDEVIAELVDFAGSDTVCYRAPMPEGLVAQQCAHWDPLVAWAERAHGARLVLVEGVMHQPQSEEALAAVRARLERFSDFALAAIHNITTLTGSALIALAVADGEIDGEAGWCAGHVDEDWQIEQWGEDDEALRRRARRRAEFDGAVRFLGLL